MFGLSEVTNRSPVCVNVYVYVYVCMSSDTQY